MRAAAVATLIGMAGGCFAAIGYIWRIFGAVPPFKTLLRIGLAIVVLFGVDFVIPTPVEWVATYGRPVFLLIVLGKMVVLGIVLLAVLGVSGEFTSDDLDKIKRVIGRKKKPQETD